MLCLRTVLLGSLVVAGVLVMTVSPVSATLIAYDGFGTSGTLNGESLGSGFSDHWSAPADVTLAASSLVQPNGAIPASGGSVATSGTWPVANRTLSQAVSTNVAGTYYLSFDFARISGDYVLAGLRAGSGNTLVVGVWGGLLGIDIQEAGNNYATATGSSLDSTPRLAIMKLVTNDGATNKVSVYMKAYSSAIGSVPAVEPLTWDVTASRTFGSALSFNQMTIIDDSVGHYDEIRLGTAWSDVVVPEPSTVILLATGLISLLCYAWRKRK